MRGDALASGDRSAMFFPPAAPIDIAEPVAHATEYPCVCGDTFTNVSSFVEHAHGCDGEPKATHKIVYVLGRTTIEEVARQGALETPEVNFVAADDLFGKNPYEGNVILAGPGMGNA